MGPDWGAAGRRRPLSGWGLPTFSIGTMPGKLSLLQSQGIENVVIFVCDALRWDSTPKELTREGFAIKTVASSLYTALSFPSMVSGLYPPRHKVETWQDKLPKDRLGLLSFDGYHVSLWDRTTWPQSFPGHSPLRAILGDPPDTRLSDISAPFVYIEHDKGGHCPYGIPLESLGRAGCPEFFAEQGRRGPVEMRKNYLAGVRRSVDRFRAAMRTLERRRLAQSTLVVFTSDHGELLGEYGGLTAHGRPACPELVYVPTVFVHPVLSGLGLAQDGVMRHVDLYPTLAHLLGQHVSYVPDGSSLLEEQRLPSLGLNVMRGAFVRRRGVWGRLYLRFFAYRAESVWDRFGGHVFHCQPMATSVAYFILKLLSRTKPLSHYMSSYLHRQGATLRARAYWRALRHLASPYLRYGSPALDKRTAVQIVSSLLHRSVTVVDASPGYEERPFDSNEEVVDRLTALGYMD